MRSTKKARDKGEGFPSHPADTRRTRRGETWNWHFPLKSRMMGSRGGTFDQNLVTREQQRNRIKKKKSYVLSRNSETQLAANLNNQKKEGKRRKVGRRGVVEERSKEGSYTEPVFRLAITKEGNASIHGKMGAGWSHGN